MQNQFPDIPNLADIARGDPIPGEWLTALKNLVVRLSEQAASGAQLDSPVELADAAGRPAIVEQWLGRITAAGSANATYYITKYYPDKPATASVAPSTSKVTLREDFTFPAQVHALNIGEISMNGTAVSKFWRPLTFVHVFAIYSRDANQSKLYFFDLPAPGLFPVTLSQTTGLAGSTSAFCTYAYTVYGPAGPILATGKQPLNSRARTFKCTAVAGNMGTAYFDMLNDGALYLWDCNETTNLCDFTAVTGVTCNGDGTISVMTDTFKKIC